MEQSPPIITNEEKVIGSLSCTFGDENITPTKDGVHIRIPTIQYDNYDKTLSIFYFGEDEVFLKSTKGIISIHLGDIEWLINTLENM